MLGQRATRRGAHVNGAPHGAGSDDSKGFGPVRPPLPGRLALRGGLAVLGLAGALALLVATFTTIIRITVGATAGVAPKVGSDSGWDRHGPALIVLALLGLWLLATGLRGARGARVALAGLAVVGVVTMAIAFASDRPDVHRTGSVGDIYAEARAEPGAGYTLETVGGVLLLVAGGGLLLLDGLAPVRPEPDSRRRPPRRAGTAGAR
jgi:hypothetical protein